MLLPVDREAERAPQRLEDLLVLLDEPLAQLDEVRPADRDLALRVRLLGGREVGVVGQRRVAAHAEVVLHPALGRQAVVVPAHRVEHLEAAHPLEPRDQVGVRVGEDVADVQRPRHRRGRRVDRVDLLAGLRPVEGVGVVVLPALRPGGLEPFQRRLVRYDDRAAAAGGRLGRVCGVRLGGHGRNPTGARRTGENDFRPDRHGPLACAVTTIDLFDDPAAFLHEVRDHLAQDPVLTTVVALGGGARRSRRARVADAGAAALVRRRPVTPPVASRGSRCGPHRSRRTRCSCCRCRTRPPSRWPGCSTSGASPSEGRTARCPAVRVLVDETARLSGGTVRVRMHTRLFELARGPRAASSRRDGCGPPPRRTSTSRSPGSRPSTATPTSRPAARAGTRPRR